MESSVAVEGREFDWFARDATGAIAIFATGGSGPVPQSVLRSVAAHDAASDVVPVSGWGSPQVWKSYAAAGLYAYDWDSSKELYLQVAAPTAPLLPQLAILARDMPLPAFHSGFPSALELGLGDLQHGT